MNKDYFVHESAYVDQPATIGRGTSIWHFCHVLAGATIGDDCVLGQNVMVGSRAVVGSGVRIQNNVSIYDGVRIEDDAFVGPSAVFTNVINPRSPFPRKDEFRTTLVKRGATIGANATIICGVTLGAHCMVGAGAVVTHDVPEYALVIGVPARRQGWISRYGQRLCFDTDGIARCERTGDVYHITDAQVVTRTASARPPAAQRHAPQARCGSA